MNSEVDLRLSAQMMGSRANPRTVWSLGVSKDFLQHVSPEHQMVTLSQENGVLSARLGTEGVKLSWAKEGDFAWAGSLGDHHLRGIKSPSQMMPAEHLQGRFDPESLEIRFLPPLPTAVTSSFIDVEALIQETSRERHFPATHFQDDIEEAAHGKA